MTPSSPSPATPTGEPGALADEVTVGIVTALAVEQHAMEEFVDDLQRFHAPGDRSTYRVGTVPSNQPGQAHRVALVMMPRDGNPSAATYCANMLRTFPRIHTVIMTGVAGGIPRPEHPSRHVRLGDVVVATDGIVSYGSVRQEGDSTRLRQPQGAGLVSNWLMQSARELQLLEQDGDRPWERWLDPEQSELARSYPRPAEETDVLYVRRRPTTHPDRPAGGPADGMPRVHYGLIGSADALMVDEDMRDRLADDHRDMRAIEMEGSGIATSTAVFDRTWFMVRGVVDYCEARGKTDSWHPYASYAAAAYIRALLEAAQPIDLGERRLSAQPLPLVAPEDQDGLDALLHEIPADLDLRAIWRATVPDLWEVSAEVLSSPPAAYHFLARMNADPSGLHSAVLFVAVLSEHLRSRSAELADRLRSWAEARAEAAGVREVLRTRLQSGAGPETAVVGPLLLIEMSVVGIDWGQCRITPYLQGASGSWRPRPVPDETVDRAGIGEAVSKMVARAEEIWAEGDAVGEAGIEFLLPGGLLNLPVQWYEASRLGFPQPICIRYPVAVRSVERMREKSIRREWVNRWRLLDRQPFTGAVKWGVRYENGTTFAAWAADLSGDGQFVLVVLSDPPSTDLGRDELVAALSAGVPVILWDQRLQRSPQETMEGLRRLTADPLRLPAELRALRVEAGQLPEHYGRSIALLWDDPTRVLAEEAGL